MPMNKNLNENDELFRNAYQQFEAEPGPDVWKNIQAELNGVETVYYKRKLKRIKQASVIIIALLAGLNIYQHYYNRQAKHAISGKIIDNVKTLKPTTSQTVKSPGYETKTPVANAGNTNENNPVAEQVKKNLAEVREQHIEPVQNSFVMAAQARAQVPMQAALRNRLTLLTEKTAPPLSYASNFLAGQQGLLQPLPMGGLGKNAPQVTVRTHNNPWLLTMYASTDFMNYNLDDDDDDNRRHDGKDEIRGREHHEFSFSAGILLKKQINKNISFKTGLIYSNNAIGIRPQTLYSDNTLGYKYVTSSGYSYVKPIFGGVPARGDSINSNMGQHHLQYAIIPAMIGYTVFANRYLSVTPGAGVAANILLSTKIRTEIESGYGGGEPVLISKLQGVRAVYFSMQTNVELQYKLGKSTSITLLPSFMYAINSINNNNVVKTYPYSFGLGFGITRRL